MTNNKLIVDERQRDIGNFLVGRLLPFRKKRQVGPFVFIDHMGPKKMLGNEFMNINQHPHIGLSTLTYLYEGEIEHTDSTGAHQIIKPGDAGFMTSGRGVTHTERTPSFLKEQTFTMHGYQIWVALPKELEEMTPQFDYFPSETLPNWEENNLNIKLVAGKAFGKTSPLKGFSHLFMVDITATETTSINLKNHLKGEVAIVIVKGAITDCNEKIEVGQMLISKTDEQCEILIEKGTTLLLFGGEPLPEERFLLWNFTSSSKERLEKAKQDWIDKKFPKIEGDDTYIPFPS